MRLNKFLFGMPFLWTGAPEDIRLIHNALVAAARTDKSLELLAQDSFAFLCKWLKPAHDMGWTVDRLYGVDPLDQYGESWIPGLLFTLRGGCVIELDEKTARVRYDNGREQLVRVDLVIDPQSWAQNLPDGWLPLVHLDLRGANSP